MLIPAKTAKLKPLPKDLYFNPLLSILMSKTTTIANIQSIIKKRLELRSTDAVFLFAYNTLLQCNDNIGDLATKFTERLKNKTLVIEYTEYSVFG